MPYFMALGYSFPELTEGSGKVDLKGGESVVVSERVKKSVSSFDSWPGDT